jgi:8-oxo-dGTP pyrophosphatase MutT (NUDIX family)
MLEGVNINSEAPVVAFALGRAFFSRGFSLWRDRKRFCKEVWWVPPGGGVETADTSVFDCARRETFEETGP